MKASQLILFALAAFVSSAPADDTSRQVQIRTHTITLARIEPSHAKLTTVPALTVIFLPGDGGWRGSAVSMGRTIASWGYEVYGFDTKNYLETFSGSGAKLSLEDLASDLRLLASQVSGSSRQRVVLVGWSQGASMAIAAASQQKSSPQIAGLITLGLPETGVLGWDWRATLAVLARRQPDQPTFAVKPLLLEAPATPIWMIHGTEDEYTAPSIARSLFQAAREPKRLEEIPGANHRFDGHQDELYHSLQRGLLWIASN